MISCLYELLYIVPINILIFELYSSHLGMESNLPGVLSSAVLAVVLIILNHVSKRIRIISFGIITIILGAFLFALGKDGRAHMFSENIWIVPVAVISVFSFVIGIFLKRFRITKCIILIYCAALMALDFTPLMAIGNFEFFILIYLVLLILVDGVQYRWTKEGSFTQLSHLVMTSPIIILICVLVLIFPKSDKPYDYSYIKSLAYKTCVAFNNIKGALFNKDEQYVSTGFSSENAFAGRIGENDSAVFRMSVTNSKSDTVYYIGNICNDFSGREWNSDTGENYSERMLDTLETTCQITKYDRKNRPDYISKVNVKIENLLYNTHFYFVPGKLCYGSLNKDELDGNSKINALISKERMGYGKEYDYVVYELNYKNSKLIDMLDEAEMPSEDEWLDNVKNQGMWKDKDKGYSYNDYLEYRNRIRENYLKDTELSADVRSIVDGIYAESDSDYERLKGLEKYLKSFSYSDVPGPLPETVNDPSSYLDYFLLESREGYCMHYATAFVLMARSMGYPARYVSGYCVRRPACASYVSEQRAHAWAEVYFDNVGWVTFDATPGYDMNNGWSPSGREDDVHTIYNYSTGDANTAAEGADTAVSEPEEVKNDTFFNKGLIVKVILAVLFFLILYLGGSTIISKVTYSRLDNLDKLKFFFRKNQRILKRIGDFPKPGETLFEFRNRVARELDNLCKNTPSLNKLRLGNALDYIEDYEAVCYSDAEVTDDTISRAAEAYRLLRVYRIKSFLILRFISKK